MNHSQYAKILTLIRPGATWTLHSSPDGFKLLWQDERQAQPTQEELDAAFAKLPVLNYVEERARRYRPLTDLADALVHQAMGDPKPLADYLADCQDVKAKFPKPS